MAEPSRKRQRLDLDRTPALAANNTVSHEPKQDVSGTSVDEVEMCSIPQPLSPFLRLARETRVQIYKLLMNKDNTNFPASVSSTYTLRLRTAFEPSKERDFHAFLYVCRLTRHESLPLYCENVAISGFKSTYARRNASLGRLHNDMSLFWRTNIRYIELCYFKGDQDFNMMAIFNQLPMLSKVEIANIEEVIFDIQNTSAKDMVNNILPRQSKIADAIKNEITKEADQEGSGEWYRVMTTKDRRFQLLASADFLVESYRKRDHYPDMLININLDTTQIYDYWVAECRCGYREDHLESDRFPEEYYAGPGS